MYWFISLLNVCFKIFCRKYQMPRGRRKGRMRGRGKRGDQRHRDPPLLKRLPIRVIILSVAM